MVYTLVEPGLRDAMRQLCRRARVHYCDLLGHPIDSISRVAGVAAQMQPGARAPLDAQYFKRIEAIEFAVKYDDGVGRGLDEADIVLVGVSRTSKTPLSIYLGYLGQKAANVPVVGGIEPPGELFEIDPAKIVGLTIAAERLADIRTARVRTMGGPRRKSAALEQIYSELEEARRSTGASAARSSTSRALRRGDRGAEHPPRRTAPPEGNRLVSNPYGSPGEPPLRNPWRPPPGGRGDLREKGWAPPLRFAAWWALLFTSMLVFYVLLTPIWLGLRAAAWIAELRSRASRG